MPDRELLAEAALDDPGSDLDPLIDESLQPMAAAATSGVDVASLDALTDTELRSGETTDPLVAIEEGEVWIPPSDPPFVPSARPRRDRIAGRRGVRC